MIGLVGYSNSMEVFAGAFRVDQFAPIWPIEDRGQPGTQRYGMGGGSIDAWAAEVKRFNDSEGRMVGPLLRSLGNGFTDYPDTSGLWVQVGVRPRRAHLGESEIDYDNMLASTPTFLGVVLDFLDRQHPDVSLVVSPMHRYFDGRRLRQVMVSEEVASTMPTYAPIPVAALEELENNGRGDHLSPEGELRFGRWWLDSVLPLFGNGDPAPPPESSLRQEVEDYARRARVLAGDIADTHARNAEERYMEWLRRIGNRIGSQADHLDRLAGRL